MQVKTVVGHSLWEFLSEIQEAILEGYLLSDKSEYFPYSSGPLNIVHMVKEENEQSEEEEEAHEFTCSKGTEQGTTLLVEDPSTFGEGAESVEYNPDLVALADVVDIAEQSGAAIPPVEKKKPGRKARGA